MNNISKFFICLGILICGVIGAVTPVDLGPENFDTFINSQEIALVEFFAPWCKVCQEVDPTVEEAAVALKSKNIATAQVDCDAHKEFCDLYHIGIFPTFVVFKGLENRRAYNGPREVQDITTYMERQTRPATTHINEENFEQFKNSGEVVILGLFQQSDKKSQEIFTDIAEQLREEFDFGISTDQTLAKAEGESLPSIILYKQFDDGKSVYSGEMKKDDIITFINKRSIAWIDEFKLATSSRYFKNGIPLAFLAHEGPQPPQTLIEELNPVARDYQDAIQVVTLEYSEKLFSKLRLKPERLPSLFAINSDNKKYALEPSGDLNKLTVEAFLKGFTNEKLEEYFLSESIPQRQHGLVTAVVRDSFTDLVMDNDKDVLVEFYSPSCGHCKAFAPEYEELAKLYAPFQDQIAIVKVDSTANDIPNEIISSFPTIKLFKAGDKSHPVKFEGERSIERLAKFIGTNGTHRIYHGHDEL